jgi:hypothetical protein
MLWIKICDSRKPDIKPIKFKAVRHYVVESELKRLSFAYPDATWLADNDYFYGFILFNKLGIYPRRLLCTNLLNNWSWESRMVGRSLYALYKTVLHK